MNTSIEFKGFALKNPTKGSAFENRKPLKRLDLNFKFSAKIKLKS